MAKINLRDTAKVIFFVLGFTILFPSVLIVIFGGFAAMAGIMGILISAPLLLIAMLLVRPKKYQSENTLTAGMLMRFFIIVLLTLISILAVLFGNANYQSKTSSNSKEISNAS